MAPKKPGAKKPEKHELDAFAEKYETLALVYGDPVEVVFDIMANKDTGDETRLRAAEMLMSYRYPRLKALEGEKPTGPQVTLVINTQQPLKSPAAGVTLDITQEPKTLPGGES